MIVLDIVGYHARHLGGLDQFDRLDVSGVLFERCLAVERQALGRRRSREHIDQFFEQGSATVPLNVAALTR